MVLLPVFASLRRNSVKMALPKVATSPSITRAFFRIEVHMPLFHFPSHAALFLCSRARSNGCAWNNLGRYDLRICTNCSRQSQDQVILNAFRGQPAKFHVAYSTLQ